MATNENQMSNLSVTRALDIIEFIAITGRSLTIAEICSELSLNRVTCSKLLHSLQGKNYIYREPSGKYTLTGKSFIIGTLYKNNIPCMSQFEEFGSELAKKLNIDIAFGKMSDASRAIIVSIIPQYATVLKSDSSYVPLNATALGKILLAYQEEKIINGILKSTNFKSYTPNSIVDEDALKKELTVIRSQGYAVDRFEYSPERACISVPVWGAKKELYAAISFSNIGEPSKDRINELLPLIRDYADALSFACGYRSLKQL